MKADIIDIWTCQGGNCFYCHRPMTYDKNSYATSYTRDHFYAKRKGNGLNGNTVLAHKKCNMDKRDRDPNKQEISQFKKLYRAIETRVNKLEKIKLDCKARVKRDNSFGWW